MRPYTLNGSPRDREDLNGADANEGTGVDGCAAQISITVRKSADLIILALRCALIVL